MDRFNKTKKNIEGRDPNVVARYQTGHLLCEPLPMISLTMAVAAVTLYEAAKERALGVSKKPTSQPLLAAH